MTSASVVVNNHDYARFVREAVDSALMQTWPDTEVVVVDDGSTDGSRDLLAVYGDRVRLVLQPQRGQTGAMNAGFHVSRGEVVLFLDADDVLLPHAVEAAVTELSSGAVKAHWPVQVVDASGAPLGRTLPDAPLPSGDLRSSALAAGPQAIPFPPTSGNAWRREFLADVFPLPELEGVLHVGSASADALLSMLAVFGGELVALPDALTRYRVHGGNDYAGSGLAARVDRNVAVNDRQFEIVQRYCASRGLPVDVTGWRRSSYFHRLQRIREAIRSAVPATGNVLLVDDGHWGADLVPDRRVLPFPGRDGLYWGPPADDTEAETALERSVRDQAATHLALPWHCWWWLEVYPGLATSLSVRRTVVHSDDVILFELTGGPA